MSVEKCSRPRWRCDELGQAGLVDRDLAALQARDLVGVDVDAPDLVAELGEAGRGDEADVAGADDADGFARGAHEGRPRIAMTLRRRPAAPARSALADAAQRARDRRASAGWSGCAAACSRPSRRRASVRQATSAQAVAVGEELVGAPAHAHACASGCRGSAAPSSSCPGRRSTGPARRWPRPSGRRGGGGGRGRRCRRRAACRTCSRPRVEPRARVVDRERAGASRRRRRRSRPRARVDDARGERRAQRSPLRARAAARARAAVCRCAASCSTRASRAARSTPARCGTRATVRRRFSSRDRHVGLARGRRGSGPRGSGSWRTRRRA